MRYGGSEPLRRFDVNDTADLDAVYQQICMWARKVKLNSDPAMPSELRNRQADNWRPLVSVADSFGPYWGKAARDTAITFSKGYRDEDIAVVLLADIRDQFNARGVDRFASADLVAALTSMDDGPWAEWRGAREDQHPRKFSQGELAKLLSPFGIKSKSIWPRRRHDAGVSSSKGYTREQFEAAWRSYLDEAGTAAQPQDITHLRAL
jgi:hypothetical protein